MRTEIITRNIYTFAELSDDAKQNVLNSWRESGIDFDNDAEFILDMWKERLENIGFKNCTINYSGFSSQGDGACFITNHFDLTAIIEHFLNCSRLETYNKYSRFLASAWSDYIELNMYNIGRYSHENSVKLELQNNCLSSYASARVNGLIDDLIEDLNQYRRELSQEIYKSLEHAYEYANSDEHVIEIINCNDYEFTEDGKML